MKLIVSRRVAQTITRLSRGNTTLVIVVAVFAFAGLYAVLASRAAGPFVASETEQGTTTGCATKQSDTGASGGSAVNFAKCLLFDFDDLTPFTGTQAQQATKYEFTPCSSAQGANNAQYASIVSDPAGVIDSRTGAARKVIKMTTPNNAGGGTDTGARCQLEMWPMLQEGGEYWEALSWYFPSDFPQHTATPNWHAIHGSYGTGATGNSPFRIDILNYYRQPDGSLGQRIYIVRKDSYDREILWEMKIGGISKPVTELKNRWIDVALHYRVGRNQTGWMEIYVNAGNGWERQKFSPTTAHHTTSADGYRAYYATADPLSNGEPPYDTRINNYYMYDSYLNAGFPDPNTGPTIYHGNHRIGTSFAGVGGSWSHANQTGAPAAESSGTAPAFFDTADWLWKPIPSNPVLDPNSATWAGYYAAATNNKVIDTYDYGSPIYYTHDAQGNRRPGAYKNVTATHTEWGTNPFAPYNPIWIPDDAAPSPKSDAAMVIIDPSRNLTFEFWEARKDASGNWIMGWGGALCYHGRGTRTTGGCETNQFGAVGSGMSRLAGLITREDIQRGVINHAMVFATNIAKPTEFRFPATKTDGRNLAGVATPIPEGARIQLDPAADISGLTGYQRMVAEALKTYGAYVIDNGGAPTPIGGLALIGEGQDPAGPKTGTPYFSPTTPVPGNPVFTGSTFYNSGMRDGGAGYQSLSNIPWNKLRVLKSWDGK